MFGGSLWVHLPWSPSSLEFIELLECFYSCLPSNLVNHYFFRSLSVPFSLYSGNPTVCVLTCLVVSYMSVRLCSFFNLLVPQTWPFLVSYIQVHRFFLLPAQICIWILAVNFSSQLFILFSSRISLWFLFRFSIPLLFSILFIHHLLDLPHTSL